MSKSVKASKPKTTDTTGDSPISRTNRFFVKLAEYGHCDDKGRVVMGLGLRGRQISKPDRPLCSLMLPILDMLIPCMDYTSKEAAKKDLEQFKKALAEWHVED